MLVKIAFVVLHYGDPEVTENCIRSILRMEHPEKIVIVIVDNNTQRPLEERKHFEEKMSVYSQITVLRNEGSGGFSEANNKGYMYARTVLKADSILVLNNDIEFPQPDFILRLEKSVARMNCYVIGPNVVGKRTGEPQNPLDTRLRTIKEAEYTIRMNRKALRILPAIYPLLLVQEEYQKRKTIRRKKTTSSYYKTIQRHIVPFGACLIFSPDFVLREEKAFSPETQFYYEEYLLALRCWGKGYETGYDPSLRGWHEGGTATRQSYGSRIRKMRFVMKNTADACEIYRKELEATVDDQAGRKKLLYFMSVEWGWIAQRPHFLALELEKKYDVTVVAPRFMVRNWEEQKATRKPEHLVQVPQIPMQERFDLLRAAGTKVFRQYIGNVNNYDIVWFGTPMFYRILPKDYRGKVVYDYMDDIAALQSSNRVKDKVVKDHQRLLARADRIFVTSRHLMESLDEESRDKAFLMRNAYREGQMLPIESSPEAEARADRCFRLGYIGTIAEWMDFDILKESLEHFSNIEYHLWGPAGRDIPENERIIYHGIAEHNKLPELVRGMDCLMMPFKINQIVLAVDPVKLYEYISFGKPILCIRYPEIERFEPFVWFYRNYDEFATILKALISGEKGCRYTEDTRKQFLEDNSWEFRGSQICKILEEKNGI